MKVNEMTNEELNIEGVLMAGGVDLNALCKAQRIVAELRESLRVSSNAMEMVVQWLGKYPKWQNELKHIVAENRKALERSER